jgi:hypothetical protein
MKRNSAFRAVAVVGFVLGLAGPIWANGEEFFAPAKNGKIDLVYVGAGIKEIGEQVDVTAFEIAVNVAGYKRATITRMPRKVQGTIELDVRLEPVISGEVSAAGFSAADAPPYTRTWIALIGSLLLFVIVKAARTSSRRRTTTR